jgi:hypothetical protein
MEACTQLITSELPHPPLLASRAYCKCAARGDARALFYTTIVHFFATSPPACTVHSTSDYTLWNMYRSYFKGISAHIKLQMYNVTCCSLYARQLYFKGSLVDLLAVQSMRIYMYTTRAILSPKG